MAQGRIQHLSNNGGKLSSHDVYSTDGALTQLSHGIIFDIQTSVLSSLAAVVPEIQIVALDIYAPIIQNEIVYYELYYSKRDQLLDGDSDSASAIIGGSTDDDSSIEGLPQFDTFTFITNGTIPSSSSWKPPPPSSSSSLLNSSNNNNDKQDGVANNNVGELTRIFINNNNNNTTPLLLLDGDGSRYSIYFTLNSRNLLYARERSSSSLQHSWEKDEEGKSGDNATTTTTEDEEGDNTRSAILASTSDLILYEGVAVMTYPYTNADRLTNFRYPRGFIGRIWYQRCGLDCNCSSGSSGSSSSSSSNSTTPTTANTTNKVETKGEEVVDDSSNVIKECITKTNEELIIPDIDDVFLASFFDIIHEDVVGNSNVTSITPTMNDSGPTITPIPSYLSSPTIMLDDDDDDDTYMRVYLILTFDGGSSGLPNRILNNKLGETQAFTNMIMEFYTTMELLLVNEVELYNCDIWYQQHIPFVTITTNNYDDENDMNARLLQQQQEQQQLHKQKQHQNLEDSQTIVTNDEKPWYTQSSLSPPQSTATISEDSQTTVLNDTMPWHTSPPLPTSSPLPQSTAITMISGVSLEITIILSILYTPLPQLITEELLQTLMSSNKKQLLITIQNDTLLAPYFFSNSLSSATTSISSIRIIDNVTLAPTDRPTESPTNYIPTVPPTREPAIINGWQFSLLIYGVLSIFTLLYIKRARDRMRLARHVHDNVGTEYDNLLSMEAYYSVIPPKAISDTNAVAEMDTFMNVIGLTTNNNNSNTFIAAMDNNDSSNKPKRRLSVPNTFRESMTLDIPPTVLSGMDDDDNNNNDHVNISNNNEDDSSNDQLVKQTKTIGGGQSAPATDVTGQQHQQMLLMHSNAVASAGAATTMRKSIMGSILRNVKYKSKKDPLGMDVSFIEGKEKNEMGNNDDDDDDDDDEDQEEESDDDNDSNCNDEKGRRMKIQTKKNRFRD